MLKIAPGLDVTFLTRPTSGLLEHAHCSGIVAFEDGELLAVYFHAVIEAHRKQAIYGVRKLPGAKSWEGPFLVSKDVKFARMEGNPVVWVAPDTRKLWLFYVTSWGGWSTCILRRKISTDRGHTWSKSEKIYGHISRVSKNPPILTSKGWYVLPASVEFRECTPLFYLSQDQGKTWEDVGARITVPEKDWPETNANKWGRLLDQPTVIEREDGSLYCLMRAYRPLGHMWETISQDGGLTWTPPRPSILPNPDGGFHMTRLQSGRVAIIYNHSATERNPLSVALSEDEGRSWTYRRNLCEFHPAAEKDPRDNFQYPTITQGPDGTLHATWSFGHSEQLGDVIKRVTDIQYASFSEEWVAERPFFEDTWEL